jgi:DNA-binding beta-propeller fold protein YncE
MSDEMPAGEMPAGEVPAGEVVADDLPVAAPPVVDGDEPQDAEEEKRRRRKKALLLLLLGLLAMLITIAIWYLIFRQPINPLPPIPVTQIPGYTTSFYGANNPLGVAVSPDGSRIYAAETEGERVVRVFDAAGTLVATARPPESSGGEHVPVFVAIDPLTSEVYVTDRPTGSIYIYDRDGAYQRTLTLEVPIPGWQPVGIAFDSAGWLYVTDLSAESPRIQVIDRTANVVRTLGEADKMAFPNGLAVDAAGRVYVADSNNGRLLVFGVDGSVIAQVGRGAGEGNLGLPRGIAVDSSGRVFVGDATGQGVFVFRVPDDTSRRLEYLGFFGGEGVADGRFSYPNGVAVDGRGRVYVADTVNDRVQMWSY